MIRKTKVCVWSYNKKNKLEDKLTTGKWIKTGFVKYFEKIFPEINKLVDQGAIFRAKYTHKENSEYDPLPHFTPILCVYGDDKTKERTKNELIKLGIIPDEWKYDTETKKDWAPDGKLHNEYIFRLLIDSEWESSK
ncbi:MAG: hypothetical protein KKF46_04515 [Nanoarchaeota archaeon]|nr:hypothetical protein [Nanoarchaeota archaeon]MBU1321600.1 hypothetical protein [Nanoarchaeota archaeon]MBU1598006.1 hypothetical protein [Nanoarchaeota archaeon]MBU2440956.1 hypothetical protein [Nanoarchaeota archaeon]